MASKLSNETRKMLVECAQFRLAQLNELHWHVVGFMDGPKGNHVIKNIAAERRKVEAAIKAIDQLYEGQFKKT